MGDFGDPGLERGDDLGRGAQGDAGFADRLMHGFAQSALHFAGGKRGQRRRRQLLGRRQRQLRGFGPHRLDLAMGLFQRGAQGRHQLVDGVVDLLGGARRGRLGALGFGLGAHDVDFLDGQGLFLTRARGIGHHIAGAAEFGVEGEFAGAFHQ